MSTLSTIKVGAANTAMFVSVTISSGSYALASSTYDNTSAGATAFDLRLNISAVAPTAGGTVQVYRTSQLDGSAFPVPGNAAAAPPAGAACGAPYVFTGASTTAMDFENLPLAGGPYVQELILFNNSSAAITISTSRFQATTLQIV